MAKLRHSYALPGTRPCGGCFFVGPQDEMKRKAWQGEMQEQDAENEWNRPTYGEKGLH